MGTDATNESSFSSDLISVRISGKEVDDLSFVDLPGKFQAKPLCHSHTLAGIIASVREGGRESDIKQLEKLVMSFIQRPSCLILLVVSCESTWSPFCISLLIITLIFLIADIENQGARRLAKQVDRSGKRTIR